jgi:CheY-like chemotaxis protein
MSGMETGFQMAKVLVVDDERDGAEGMAMFFRCCGHETATAYNGVEALEVSASFKPDAVILDIEMPLMDGFQAARAMRDRSTGSKPLLVAVTALADNDVAERAKSCGFDFYLAKPANLESLRALVEQARPAPLAG